MTKPDAEAAKRRRSAYRRGRRGEMLAAWWLRLKGYRIVARGLRSGVGEIDILAARGRVLAAVEVKARPDLGAAVEAIGRRQRARISQAVRRFVGARREFANHEIRFDVILVAPGRWPRHLPDAWRQRDDATE